MVGGYITLMSMNTLGIPYILSIFVSILVVALLSVLMERAVFYPLRNAPPIHDKIAAIGIMLFLESLAIVLWGTEYHRMTTPFDNIINIGSITITAQRILVIVTALVVVLLLYLFLRKTMIGASIRAMAQNREGAYLVGINANVVAMLTFAIAGGLVAIAASIAAPLNLVFPSMGHLVIMKAFIIVIIGGMGSIPGAIFGGFLIGITE